MSSLNAITQFINNPKVVAKQAADQETDNDG